MNAIAELTEYCLRDVDRVLRYEEDTNTLGTNETDDLLDSGLKNCGQIVEEQMSFIEEEDQLRLFGIADFGQFLEELAS